MQVILVTFSFVCNCVTAYYNVSKLGQCPLHNIWTRMQRKNYQISFALYLTNRFSRHMWSCYAESFDTLLLLTKSSPLCLMKTVLNKDTEGAIIAQFDGWAVGQNVKLPWPLLWCKKVLFLEGRHAVIEVFTTRQKCDGTENVGDSDAWLNRLLYTDCRAALWIVMPHFIVLRLKGSHLREMWAALPPALFDIEVQSTKSMSAQQDKAQQTVWEN